MDVKEVRAARKEEVGYMQGRNIWTVVSDSESWEVANLQLQLDGSTLSRATVLEADWWPETSREVTRTETTCSRQRLRLKAKDC